MARRRAQVILMTAVVIIVLILAIASSLYLVSVSYSPLRYRPAEEVLLDLRNDLTREAVHLLNSTTPFFTNDPSTLGSIDLASRSNLSFWQKAAEYVFGAQGLKLSLGNGTYLAPANYTYLADGVPVSGSRVTNFTSSTLSGAILDWGTGQGTSGMNLTLGIDITGLGLTGYLDNVFVGLNLTIFSVTSGLSSFNILLTADSNAPAQGLSMSSFKIYYWDTGGTRRQGNFWAADNFGNGNYTLYVTENGTGVTPPLTSAELTHAVIEVMDTRGIVVGASTFNQVPGTVYYVPSPTPSVSFMSHTGTGNLWNLSTTTGSPINSTFSFNPKSTYGYLELVPFTNAVQPAWTGSANGLYGWRNATVFGHWMDTTADTAKVNLTYVMTAPGLSAGDLPTLIIFLYNYSSGTPTQLASGTVASLSLSASARTITVPLTWSVAGIRDLTQSKLGIEFWLSIPHTGGDDHSGVLNITFRDPSNPLTITFRDQFTTPVVPLSFPSFF